MGRREPGTAPHAAMTIHFGRYGPTLARLGALGRWVSLPWLTRYAARRSFHRADSDYARERAASFKEKLRRGETVYLVGIGPAGHNSGAALVEVSPTAGVRLICNNEEERYSGVKHTTNYPAHSLAALFAMMEQRGIGIDRIHAFVASWDYVQLASTLIGSVLAELPASRVFLNPKNFAAMNNRHIRQAFGAPARLGRQLGHTGAMPIIGMRHHCNHAYFSHAVSPFAGADEPVLISVLDGLGDDGAISLYLARGQNLELIYRNPDIFDSLGGFYSMISSTQGGWTILSSEGRYMGAAAWGDGERLTNPYYRPLRELFHFAPHGALHLNRDLANWPRELQIRPYKPALEKSLGAPIPIDALWNPDAVMKIDDSGKIIGGQDRFDKAAATQLVFEDALFHIVDHLIRTTGARKLILTGGTALNATANMRLMQHYDAAYFRRFRGRENLAADAAGLHIWVPPTPGDAGVPAGAAYHFALANGASYGEPLRHAFYCGTAPTADEIETALRTIPEIAWVALGSTAEPSHRHQVAALLADIISQDGVLGLFQGAAETGPRALGHRSILANPCNPRTLETINRLVKFREPFRPLAPMATLEAAQRFFELQDGGSDDAYNAYNYMTLTVRARPESFAKIPAVVHHDGTSRVQIVRAETDPLTHAYLQAMGRCCDAEISVNTSLNVAGPIVQTPEQALQTLKRANGMDGLLLVGAGGEAFLAWHTATAPPKDGGRRLGAWLRSWQQRAASPGMPVTA